MPPLGEHLRDLIERAEHRRQLADLRGQGRRAAVVHPPEEQNRVHPLAALLAIAVAAEVGCPNGHLPPGRPERDVTGALVFERVARPLGQGAGLVPILRVVERGLHGLGQQEGSQAIGQFADRAFPRLEILGGADEARVAAFGLDLLLDVLDLGPDLGESIARLLRSVV